MKTVKIEFTGQSKAVIADVKIEYTDPTISNEEILKEVTALYEEAYKYADYKTKQLNGVR